MCVVILESLVQSYPLPSAVPNTNTEKPKDCAEAEVTILCL